MMKGIESWGEALNGVVAGEVTPQEAAQWAVDNRVKIEFYEPDATDCRVYPLVLEAYNTIKAGLEAPTQPQPRPTKTCTCCGGATYELMTSARGSVCPDCYDRWGGE